MVREVSSAVECQNAARESNRRAAGDQRAEGQAALVQNKEEERQAEEQNSDRLLEPMKQ